MINSIRHPIRERFASKAVLALDVVSWLFCATCSCYDFIRFQYCSNVLGPREQASDVPAANAVAAAIGIVTRICGLRVFRARFFPKLCLRQSLTLYRS